MPLPSLSPFGTRKREPRRGAAPSPIAPLFLQAELEAMRLAALVRAATASFLIVFFLIERPPELPPRFAPFILAAFGANLAAAAVPFVLRARTRLLAGLATTLALFDVAVFAAMLLGTVTILGLPLSMFGATPTMLFGIVLLTLAALRFDVRPLVIIGASVVALLTTLALVGGAIAPQPLADRAPPTMFASGANLIRAALILAVVVVLSLVVTRGRRLLVEALEVGERAGNLARYLPRKVAEVAAREGVGALSQGREQPAAVLFADIVGFTALSERLPPEAVGRLLTELRTRQRRAIEDEGGIVDKFIGDAVMGVFGVPDPDDGAARQALAAAASMRRALEAWRAERARAGLPAARTGIGIHYGTVFAGAVGDSARLEFAVLGDTVNVAQRCERLTREVGADLVVTGAVLEAAREPPGRWRRLDARRVHGRAGAVEVWAPLEEVAEAPGETPPDPP